MKRLNFYPYVLAALFLCATVEVSAQGRGNEKHRKEYTKQKEKNRKSYYKEREKDRKAYNKYVEKSAKHHTKKYKRNGPPHWAPAHGYRAKHHVYFRDYYTFYDPYRDGYVYRHNNGWRFSRSVPAFLVNVDLGRARVQYLTDVPLNQRPERFHSRYSKRYPRDPRVQVNISLF